jgi:hypothetical protein
MERWRAVFSDVEALRLRSKLVEGLKLSLEDGKVVLEGSSRDEVWRAAEWISHNAVPGKKLFYSVIGERVEKGLPKIIYLSYCRLCREGKHEHGEG